MPLRLLGALCALLLMPAAAHAEGGFTKQALKVDVTVGPDDATTCTIDADLYKPDGVSAANPAPAILATNGFGGDKTGFSVIAPSYAKRGYVFLAYSGLGFGDSTCKITLDDPDWDGKAGSQLVSLLGGGKAATDGTRVDFVRRDARAHDGSRHDDDPRVGMINGSYGGQIQFAIAAVDPRLDAISPLDTWNDLSYSLAPNNTDFARGVSSATPGVFKLDWPAAFSAVGLAGGVAGGDPSRAGACPNFPERVCAALAGSAITGYPDAAATAFLRHASVASYIERIRIPVFLAQGQHDTLFNLQESIATYEALRAQRTPVRLLWESAGHSGGGLGTSEYDPASLETAYQTRMELEFLDYHLRAIGDRPPEDFSFFRDWEPYKGDAAPAVGNAPSYPVGSERSWHLSGADALVASAGEAPNASAQIAALAAPASTGGGMVDLGSQSTPVTSASFTSAPLERDTDVVGIPELTVSLDAPAFAAAQSADPATKLVLFAKLDDVGPDGSVVLPANLLSPVRVADVTKPVAIQLPGIVHRFARGHRLRLTLATSNVTFRGNNLAGTVGITSGTVRIPVLGPQAGPTGSGPSGTTPFADRTGRTAVPPPAREPARRRAGAAVLPRADACRRHGRLRIRLRRAARGDRIRSVRITANGRRVHARKGRSVRRRITLRRLPRRAFRLVVTVRTAKGVTRTSARTYGGCIRRPGPR